MDSHEGTYVICVSINPNNCVAIPVDTSQLPVAWPLHSSLVFTPVYEFISFMKSDF